MGKGDRLPGLPFVSLTFLTSPHHTRATILSSSRSSCGIASTRMRLPFASSSPSYGIPFASLHKCLGMSRGTPGESLEIDEKSPVSEEAEDLSVTASGYYCAMSRHQSIV